MSLENHSMAPIDPDIDKSGLALNPLRLLRQRAELTPLICTTLAQMDGLREAYDTQHGSADKNLIEEQMNGLLKQLEPLGLQLGKIDAVLLAEIAALILGFMAALAPFYKN